MTTRAHTCRSFIPALWVATVCFALAPAAHAQSPAPPVSTGTSAQNSEPSDAPPAAAPPVLPRVERPYWEPIGGYEADTHNTGYAFFGPSYVHPIRPGLAWTARVFPNYLYYQFAEPNGATQVRSPGISSAVGVRFGEKSFVRIGAGPEVKWRRTEFRPTNGPVRSSTDTVIGLSAGGEVYANPTSHNNVHGLVNYNTSDRYTWSRLGFKEQLNNFNWQGPLTTFLGVEGIAQGNQDIRSTQLGGFVELAHVPSSVSVMLKAGYKRSTFDVGPDKTGPYFAVSFYQRLK